MANNKTSVIVSKLNVYCVYLLCKEAIFTRSPSKMDLNDDELIVFTNYMPKLFRAFSNCFHSNEFADATLQCENKLIQVHKFLLSASSPYFDNIFRQNVDNVVIENVSHDILLAVVEYIYNGRVVVQSHQLSSFIKATNMFSMVIPDGGIQLISVNEQSSGSSGENSQSSSYSDLFISSGKWN